MVAASGAASMRSLASRQEHHFSHATWRGVRLTASCVVKAAGKALIKAEMMGVIGDVYYSLGLLEESRTLYEKGLAIKYQYDEKNILSIAKSYHDLGDVNYDLGEYKLADTQYTKASDVAQVSQQANDQTNLLESAQLFQVRFSFLLGLQDVQSNVFCHQIEIRIVVHDLEAVLGTESADENVNSLTYSHAL